MPISSGAGARAVRAARLNGKTNLRPTHNWPDVARSSPSLATSSSSSSGGGGGGGRVESRSRLLSKGATKGVGSNQQQENSSSSLRKSTGALDEQSVAEARESLGVQQAGMASVQRAPHTTINHQSATAEAARVERPLHRLDKIMSSLGGQRVVIEGGERTQLATNKQRAAGESGGQQEGALTRAIEKTDSSNTKAAVVGEQSSGGGKRASLMSSLILGGVSSAGAVETNPNLLSNSDNYKKPRAMVASGKTQLIIGGAGANSKSAPNYHLGGGQAVSGQHRPTSAKSSLQNSQASLLNPSMSFLSGQPNGAGAQANSATASSSSLADLHNLHSHHHRHHQHNRAHRVGALNISRRVNLKYVKSLIVLLMSLDLLITIFVYHFSSHDELAVAFTSHKLRFSLLNLVLSSIWFIVLSGAIIFDVYPVLLIGCLVDFASFILLLVCSLIHFTQRIDYNTVNLTSLLLLLFSIIVLHVYLLVIAALTFYLMLAVKRRRKIQS